MSLIFTAQLRLHANVGLQLHGYDHLGSNTLVRIPLPGNGDVED